MLSTCLRRPSASTVTTAIFCLPCRSGTSVRNVPPSPTATGSPWTKTRLPGSTRPAIGRVALLVSLWFGHCTLSSTRRSASTGTVGWGSVFVRRVTSPLLTSIDLPPPDSLPFFAVTPASAFSPAVPPRDDAATPEPDRSRLQAGTARKTARSATARRIARLYEARCQLCKFRLETRVCVCLTGAAADFRAPAGGTSARPRRNESLRSSRAASPSRRTAPARPPHTFLLLGPGRPSASRTACRRAHRAHG